MKVARILHVNGGGGSQSAKILGQVKYLTVANQVMVALKYMGEVCTVFGVHRVNTKLTMATRSALQIRIAGLGNTGLEEASLIPQPVIDAPRVNIQHRGMSTAARLALRAKTHREQLANVEAPQTPSSAPLAITQSAPRTSTVPALAASVAGPVSAPVSSATHATIWTAPPKATTCTEQEPVVG